MNYLSPIQIKLIKITVICLLSIVLASYFKNIIRKQMTKQSQNKIVLEQISNIVYYGILAFGLIIILIEVGVQKATIYTLLVSVGITIGISFQPILLRCLSGVYIIMTNLYDIGDKIRISSISGRVQSFNLFNTTIYNEIENVNIVIPNDLIGQKELFNYSRSLYQEKVTIRP